MESRRVFLKVGLENVGHACILVLNTGMAD